MAFENFLLTSSVALLAVAVWFSSTDFKPAEYHLPPPPPLKGPLAVNRPKTVEKLLEGQLIGAESVVVEKNTLYTCTTDGKCLKIVDGKIQKVVPLTEYKNCEALTRQSITHCGRPLGIRRQNAEQFIVADAMLGLLAVNFEKGTKQLLLPSSTLVDGKRLVFTDDFDFILDNDTIAFSDASTRYGYNDFLLAFLEHVGDGRIIKYKISTGELQTMVQGLNFPNGVQTHPDKQSILFCESATARVHRFYFAGQKKGRHEIFADNLPGFPDNIRVSANGQSFYVALFAHRSADSPDFFDRFGPYPLVRKAVGELLNVLPGSFLRFFFEYSHSSYGIIVELDLNGKIVRSYHDPEGKVIKDISQVSDDGGNFLYLASFHNNYIGRMSKN